MSDAKEWRPDYPCAYAPVFEPAKWSKSNFVAYFFGWPGWFAPWNLVYVAVTALSHFYTTPSLDACREFSISWMAPLFLRNQVLLWIFAGGWHALLYWPFRANGLDKKYDRKWPAAAPKFLFGHQTYENVFWSCTSGVLIWTLYEAMFLKLWASGGGAGFYESFFERPVWSAAQLLLIPWWREFHFYWVHRMTHWKPLYRHVHYLHHKNVNPGPWSGLSMHPVEHLLYFSVVAIHAFVPGCPFHLFFNAQHTALTPAGGHHGFEGPVAGDLVPGGSYFHYLHHRYFECNYGEASIPFDKWFGTFRDGQSAGIKTATKGGGSRESMYTTALTLAVGTVCSLLPLAPLVSAVL